MQVMFSPTLVHEYLSLSAERFPEKNALICGEDRWTYRSISQYSDTLASVLINQMGLHCQDRVVIFGDSSAESVIALFGILKAGGVFVILESSIKAKKLLYILRDSGATILITHVNKANVVKEAFESLSNSCRLVWFGDSSKIPKELVSRSLCWDDMFQDSGLSSISSRNVNRCLDIDLAALIYTSGSTGEPKGVMSSHLNIVSAAQSIIQYLENEPDDIILNTLPLSFDYGLYQVIMSIMFGGTVILESFLYPIKILELLEKEKVTGFPIVPTIAALLFKLRNLKEYDFSSLRYITNTAAVLPVEHVRRLKELLPHVRIYSMYGLTECKRVSYLPPEEIDSRPSSVGKAMPNCEVFILDGNGREVSPGEIGELVVRGGNVMQGYWNNSEVTAAIFRQGHYPGERLLYTGDLFKRDEDGFLYFVGRKDEMIKCRGERVYPKEIENVLCEMSGIAEAAVIGVPDEILGQSIKAFILCATGFHITKKEVLKHCSSSLESYKVPKYVEFVQNLPRTPNGKIDKRALRHERM